MAEHSPAVEKLVRWVIRRVSPLMTNDTRWKVEIVGKGSDARCSITVFEDP